jgi:hypothetical protein
MHVQNGLRMEKRLRIFQAASWACSGCSSKLSHGTQMAVWNFFGGGGEPCSACSSFCPDFLQGRKWRRHVAVSGSSGCSGFCAKFLTRSRNGTWQFQAVQHVQAFAQTFAWGKISGMVERAGCSGCSGFCAKFLMGARKGTWRFQAVQHVQAFAQTFAWGKISGMVESARCSGCLSFCSTFLIGQEMARGGFRMFRLFRLLRKLLQTWF